MRRDICRYIGGKSGGDHDSAKLQSQGRVGERRHHTLGRYGPAWQRSVRGEFQDFVADVESIPALGFRDTGRILVSRGGDEVQRPPALPRTEGCPSRCLSGAVVEHGAVETPIVLPQAAGVPAEILGDGPVSLTCKVIGEGVGEESLVAGLVGQVQVLTVSFARPVVLD